MAHVGAYCLSTETVDCKRKGDILLHTGCLLRCSLQAQVFVSEFYCINVVPGDIFFWLQK